MLSSFFPTKKKKKKRGINHLSQVDSTDWAGKKITLVLKVHSRSQLIIRLHATYLQVLSLRFNINVLFINFLFEPILNLAGRAHPLNKRKKNQVCPGKPYYFLTQTFIKAGNNWHDASAAVENYSWWMFNLLSES